VVIPSIGILLAFTQNPFILVQDVVELSGYRYDNPVECLCEHSVFTTYYRHQRRDDGGSWGTCCIRLCDAASARITTIMLKASLFMT
jgi:hypothetical protein